jgi:hypothetical protein
MFGPKPPGFWSARSDTPAPPLELQREYRVLRAFVDFDGHRHEPGETWRFVGSSYLPYDAGLSLFVQTPEGEWHIRLQLSAGQQRELWASFATHVAAM